MAHLRVFLAFGTVEKELSAKEMVIGRLEEYDIPLLDPRVSKEHAKISQGEDGWWVEDLNSRNGTFVNDERIDRRRLVPGDRIRVGMTDIVFDDGLVVEETDEHDALHDSVDDANKGWWSGIRNDPTLRQECIVDDVSAEDKLAIIQQIGEKLVDATQMDDVARQVLEIVVRYTDADRGFVCLFDEDWHPWPLASYGVDSESQPMRLSRTVLRQMHEEQSAVLIEQAEAHQLSLVAMHVESTMCVPLSVGEKITGFISLDSTTLGKRFNQPQLSLMIAIAHQAALAIERARRVKLATEQQIMRTQLAQHMDESVVRQLCQLSRSEDPFTPRQQKITVLFANVVSFAEIGENLHPAFLAEFYHEYLSAMTEVVFAHDGTIDKYIGDTVVALFGAPNPSDTAAVSAVRAAVAMRERIRKIKSPLPEIVRLRSRIGISTGTATCGRFGSTSRVEYTAFGDAVSIARSLMNFARPDEICVDQSTREPIGSKYMEEIDVISVANRGDTVRVYRVLV